MTISAPNKRTVDIFAIETNEARQVVSTSGPLFGDGFDPRVLDYDEYWNSEIQTKLHFIESGSDELKNFD